MAEAHIDVAALTAFATEAAGYFESRPTGGEDAAHWSNVYNAENCRNIATALQSLSAELAEARRDLATKEHMWLYECEKHAEWLEKFMAEKTRATTAEAEARAMREALEAARKYLTSAHMAPMPGIIGVQNPDSDIVAQIDRALGGSNAE